MTTPPPHLARLAEVSTLSSDGVTRTLFAAVRSVRHGVDRNGAGYYDLLVCDASAKIAAKIWRDSRAYAEAVESQLREGMVVKLGFTVGSFRDSVQLTVSRLRVLGEDDEWNPDAIWGDGWQLVEGLQRKTLVFDIETVPAVDVAQAPEAVTRAIARAAERYGDDPDKVMGLSPYFGKVVSLAFGEGDPSGPEAGVGEGVGEPVAGADEPPVTCLVVPPPGREGDAYPEWIKPMSEPELLRAFWQLAGSAELVVSFNGRGFDVPFLVIRSLVHGIPARVDLLSSPYSLRPHLDLFRLIGHGRGGLGSTSLDVVCWALGIESPKGAMDGSLVAPTYARGEIEKIAEYNVADVRATTAVYRHLRAQLLPFRNDW